MWFVLLTDVAGSAPAAHESSALVSAGASSQATHTNTSQASTAGLPAPGAISGKTSDEDKDEIIKKMGKALTAKDREIAKLQEQIRQMTEADADSRPRPVTTSIGKQVVGRVLYEVLGSGPNAGKLLTRDYKKVNMQGKAYKEWTALSEIKLHMGTTRWSGIEGWAVVISTKFPAEDMKGSRCRLSRSIRLLRLLKADSSDGLLERRPSLSSFSELAHV